MYVFTRRLSSVVYLLLFTMPPAWQYSAHKLCMHSSYKLFLLKKCTMCTNEATLWYFANFLSKGSKIVLKKEPLGFAYQGKLKNFAMIVTEKAVVVILQI